MEIVIRRKSKAEWLTLFVLAMPFFYSLLFELFKLPQFIKYLIDIAWICLLISMLFFHKRGMNKGVAKLLIVVGIFFVTATLSFMLNYQSVFYYLWGVRNNLRFFVYFFACIYFLNPKSTDNYLKVFDVAFWINLPVVIFQFALLGFEQDHLGGIFGVERGCNANSNILLVIVITRSVIYFLNKKESSFLCLAKCATALLIAALSELKVFYIEFIVILLLAAGMTRFSVKKLWLCVGAVIGIVVSLRVLAQLFPVFDDWFNLEKIMRMLTTDKGYTNKNDMNRLTTITIAMDSFLETPFQKLFGLGLGNCDYASFDFLITPFYRKYSYLNYNYFSSAFLVLETGLLGLIMYVLFFVVEYIVVNRLQKIEGANIMYCQLAKILSVMCGMMIIYNSSLRTESAFMLFFVLALPFTTHLQNAGKRKRGRRTSITLMNR